MFCLMESMIIGEILSVIKVAIALNVSVDEVLLDKYKHKGDKL